MTAPDISVVIPVFDKADVLAVVIDAFAAQAPLPDAEYIFVDDGSTDGSAALLESLALRLPGLRVIANTENKGPSLCVNEGAAAARGRLLCLLDADEIIAPDAIGTMARIFDRTGADVLHGKVARSDAPVASIAPAPLGASPAFAVSDDPLGTILRGRGFVRMAWLVKADLFRAAGGCDPRIFIQDESLPLRLAHKARRFVDLRVPVTTASRHGGHLSRQRAQQHHDRFFAAYNLLCDSDDLSVANMRALARKCFSAAWKASGSGIEGHGARLLIDYLLSRVPCVPTRRAELTCIAALFRDIPGLRRPAPGSA